jgi:serine/threonine-protein kinase
VVHRDLKPVNVLLQLREGAGGAPEGGSAQPLSAYVAKVADFGLARRLDLPAGATQSGAIVGTASYMAPEQAAGKVHDTGPAADMYALGAILYECLTGRPPFKADSLMEVLLQVRTMELAWGGARRVRVSSAGREPPLSPMSGRSASVAVAFLRAPAGSSLTPAPA